MLTPPSIAITQIFSLVCNFMSCDNTYPSPVSLLPEGFRVRSNLNNLRKNNFNIDNDNQNRKSRLVDSFGQDGQDQGYNELELESLLPPVVHTQLGIVEGYHMTVVSGRQIYAFEGIPYAEPPIGENRFREPQPVTSWNGFLEAKDPGEKCIQLNRGRVQGSEDCLRMNIYSPEIPNGEVKPKLPVFLFIHGGAFLFGAGKDYGPAYLLEQDMILVTFNYRLGILASLSTGDEVAPGNWGMKDQAMVINWVHTHISDFGGDPSRITLVGQSAGAVSTNLQMMSPLARDKPHAAICMSGGAFNWWALNTLEQGKTVSAFHARLVQCPTNKGSREMIDCVRKVPADVLVANQLFTVGWGFPLPTIEPNITGAFLTESPDDAYRNGHVTKIPLITSVTSEEANSLVSVITARRALPILTQLFDIDGPVLLGIRGKVPSDKETEIMLKIRNFYGAGNRLFFLPRQFYSDVGNGRFFLTSFEKSVQMHSQIAPTYAGWFKWTDEISNAGQLGLNPREHGAAHNDDLIFVFNSTSSPPIGRQDYSFAITKLMVNLYTNFVDNKIPSYTSENGTKYKFWDAVKDPENIRLLQIDEEVKMVKDPYKNVQQFWESLNLPDTTPYFKL